MKIPGTSIDLIEERDSSGRLVCLSAGGSTYISEQDGWRFYDGGVSMSEIALPNKLVRHVTSPHGSWVEEYLSDAGGRPVHVDGVDIVRDVRGRVIACGDWRYGYAGDDLCVIDTPRGLRHITHTSDGRPVSVYSDSITASYHYDDSGRRTGVPSLPPYWHTDELGRLWTITRPDGSIAVTYLWDGFACLARIDGAPGDPLTAVFSLDLTCTPVRVIGPAYMERLARDAFGEALLDTPGVPGLYGGAVYKGCVYYAARTLDPHIGAFTAPDPWHGGGGDPRRRNGYRGVLLTERGAYTVCQNDPVGRVDPTGEVSIPLILSSLTWSWQNNLLGWLAMDWVLNFWVSLLGAIGNGELWDRFTSIEGLSSSDRIGAFAVRRDGIWTKRQSGGDVRVWTYQHMTWSNAEEFDNLRRVQVFDPGSAFEPHLYGSILHVRPTSGNSFVLRGANDGGGFIPGRAFPAWGRTGGKDAEGRSQAQPLYNGCTVPHFPTSGIHFANPIEGVNNLQSGTAAEMVQSGAFGFGTLEMRAELVIAAASLNLNPGDAAYFGNGEGVISRVLSVEPSDGNTLVRLEDDATGVTVPGTRIRAVARQSEEDVPRGAAQEHLNLLNSSTAGSATPNDYDVGDYLRFSEGGASVGARRVTGFEARITIDSELPPALTAPLILHTMIDNPTSGLATLTDDTKMLEFPAASMPPIGSAIRVTHAGTVIPVFITDPGDTPQRLRVDRALYTGPPSQAGQVVPWNGLSNAIELTQAAPLPDATNNITYVPIEIRQAPSSGIIQLESAGVRTLRIVTGRTYDSLVLNAAVPGAADPIHVERFTPVAGGADEPVNTFQQSAALSVQPGQALFDATADPRRMVLHVIGLNTPTLTAGGTALALAGGTTTFVGTTMTVVYPAGAARDANIALSQPVVLNPIGGGAVELNLVRRLFLTITFDRTLNLTSTNLRVLPLTTGSPNYDATRLSDTEVTVLPEVNGVGRVQMPQFWPGEIVRATFNTPTVTHYYRVLNVEGTTLTLEGDPAVANLHIPAGATDLRITRMVPDDAKTGGPWIGLEGAVVGGNRVRMRVWGADTLPNVDLPVAIVDGTTAHPAVTAKDPATNNMLPVILEIVFASAPAAASYTVTFVNYAYSFYSTQFRREDDAYIISDVPTNVASALPQNLVIGVTYVEDGAPVSGELSPGTVLVPDVETFEIDRRQSLVDHELTHTIQSARWGPMLLCFLPIQMTTLDTLTERLVGLNLPQFSPYVPGTLKRVNTIFNLTIPDAQGVEFETGKNVEITREGIVMMAELRDKTVNTYKLIAESFDELRNAMPDNKEARVYVRLNRQPGFWRDLGRHSLYALTRAGTHGGVLDATFGSVYGGLFTLIGRFVYWAFNKIFRSTTDYPATAQQNGAAIRLGTDAARDAFANETRLSIKGGPGEATVVRGIAGRDEGGAVLRLNGNLPNGYTNVRVMAYSTSNPDSLSDWHNYYPATVPSPLRPANVRITRIDNEPSLAFPDEVWMKDGDITWSAKVLSATVNGDVIDVELNKPVAANIIGHEFRLAQVRGADISPGSVGRDPLGFLFGGLMDLQGAGWLRHVFNFQSEGLKALHNTVPENTFWWKLLRVFTHIAYTGMSTYGWSIIIPGWLVMDRQLGPEHMSYTEQEASSASGDLYSPAGRLFGRYDKNDHDQPRFYIGDVLRYIYYPWSRGELTVRTGPQDQGGVHFATDARVAPNVAAAPGRAVPDLLYSKDNANPYAFGVPADNSFVAADHGWIPASDKLERSEQIYVAFTRPPSGADRHRVTVRSGVTGFTRGQEANDEYQPLFFDCEVLDLTVNIAGQPITNDATIQLVQGQQARVSVEPRDGRVYAVALLRPNGGTVLRLGGDGRIVARAQNGTEAAQINRVYSPDDLYTHLQRPLVIPVREFSLQVTDTLPLFNTLPDDTGALFAGLAQNPLPGESVFVFVPAPIQTPLAVDDTTLGGLTRPSISAEATPAVLRDFVGDGAVYRITFAADTLANPVNIRFTVAIRAETTITLQTIITVSPP